MSAHTPGPWKAVRDTFGSREHRRNAVAVWVDKREADDLWIVEAADGSSVLVGGEKNARFIASAPDLLARAERAERSAAAMRRCLVDWLGGVASVDEFRPRVIQAIGDDPPQQPRREP